MGDRGRGGPGGGPGRAGGAQPVLSFYCQIVNNIFGSYTEHILFIHSPSDRHLSHFHFGAITNNATNHFLYMLLFV